MQGLGVGVSRVLDEGFRVGVSRVLGAGFRVGVSRVLDEGFRVGMMALLPSPPPATARTSGSAEWIRTRKRV